MLDGVFALVAALGSRDGGTGEHLRRTRALAGAAARELGLSPEEVRVTRYAAALHDVGKVGIPDSILDKPGKLTEEEWALVRRHPEMGAGIVRKIFGSERVTQAVFAHHERHDGAATLRGSPGRTSP